MGTNQHESHTRIIFIIILLLSKMTTMNIRIIWTYQNVFPASKFPVQPQWTLQRSMLCWTPAILHPKRSLGRSLFTAFVCFFNLIVKFSPFLISLVLSFFRKMVPPPIIPKLSVTTQTESGPPLVSNRGSGPSSSFTR